MILHKRLQNVSHIDLMALECIDGFLPDVRNVPSKAYDRYASLFANSKEAELEYQNVRNNYPSELLRLQDVVFVLRCVRRSALKLNNMTVHRPAKDDLSPFALLSNAKILL